MPLVNPPIVLWGEAVWRSIPFWGGVWPKLLVFCLSVRLGLQKAFCRYFLEEPQHCCLDTFCKSPNTVLFRYFLEEPQLCGGVTACIFQGQWRLHLHLWQRVRWKDTSGEYLTSLWWPSILTDGVATWKSCFLGLCGTARSVNPNSHHWEITLQAFLLWGEG